MCVYVRMFILVDNIFLYIYKIHVHLLFLNTDLGRMSPETAFSSEALSTNITMEGSIFGPLDLSIMVS